MFKPIVYTSGDIPAGKNVPPLKPTGKRFTRGKGSVRYFNSSNEAISAQVKLVRNAGSSEVCWHRRARISDPGHL